MSIAVFTVTSGSKRELLEIAAQYGGEVSRDGLLRWKLAIETDVPDGGEDTFLRNIQDRWLDITGEVTVRKGA